MFTDQPVTPRRLETLIELLRHKPRIDSDVVKNLLQPASLIQGQGRSPAESTLKAARDLKLIEEDDKGRLKVIGSAVAPARSLVLEAIDERVLSGTDVEPYFALFFSFVLGLEEDTSGFLGEDWPLKFNKKVYPEQLPTNPFNSTKLSGLWPWLEYVGLGWFDSANNFQCCPNDRLRRKLPDIFGRERKLEVDPFMKRVAETCAELDGGSFFRKVNGDEFKEARRISPGLAQALVELHLEGVVKLHSALDSAGWDISEVEPPHEGSLRGERLDEVEWTTARGKR